MSATDKKAQACGTYVEKQNAKATCDGNFVRGTAATTMHLSVCGLMLNKLFGG